MIQPDFKTFSRLSREGDLVPVHDTFTAALLTPVGAHLRVAHNSKYSFLLESVEGGENIARYTFTGANPEEVFRARGTNCAIESGDRTERLNANPIELLRKLSSRYKPVRVAGLPPLIGGGIGYFAYDMVRLIENIPASAVDDLGLDDCVMMFYRGLVAFDHVRHRVWVIQNVFTGDRGTLRQKYDAAAREIQRTRRKLEGPLPKAPKTKAHQPLKVKSNFTRPAYLAAVAKAKSYIRAGDIFQVVPSQRFSAPTTADPFEIYRALRVVNPSPYLYYLKLNDVSVVGSSPEMLVKVQSRKVSYRPI